MCPVLPPGRAQVGMKAKSNQPDDWQARARQNLRAAMLLVARHPPLVFPAISRLYYAAFQATLAALGRAGTTVPEHHGDVWSAAETIRPGLGSLLRDLYKWRMRADYATGPDRARQGPRLGLLLHDDLCISRHPAGGIMNPQIPTLLQLLNAAQFEFPVAFYEGDDPEIGAVIEADAFDVPLVGGVAISQRLGAILWPAGNTPMIVLPGIIDDCDSQGRRAELPDDTVWYLPAKTRSRTGVPSS